MSRSTVASHRTDKLTRAQKISYAKSKSNIVAKLDGTFRMTTGATAPVDITDLQQSIFNAPVPRGGSSTTHGLPSRPPGGGDQAMADAGTPESRGMKRPREENEEGEESDSDVAMEEDSEDE